MRKVCRYMDTTVIKKAVLKDVQQPNELLTAIRDVCRKLELVNARFEMESDDDLIESCIYERESLRARYRFLLRQAREQGVRGMNLE